MNTLWIVVIAAVVIYLAYNFYAKQHRPECHPGGCQEGHTGQDVHGRRGLHAHQPQRAVWLSLQIHRGGRTDRGCRSQRPTSGAGCPPCSGC